MNKYGWRAVEGPQSQADSRQDTDRPMHNIFWKKNIFSEYLAGPWWDNIRNLHYTTV